MGIYKEREESGDEMPQEEDGWEESKISSVALVFPSQTQVATKRQQVISQFAHLSRFLERQQTVLLAQLEGLDGDILKQQEEFDSLATREICRFSTLIEELEEKNKRPARGLLTVRPGLPSPLGSLESLPSRYLLYIHVSASRTDMEHGTGG